MNSTIRSILTPAISTAMTTQQQQYQTLYNQCIALKKDYDLTTDIDLKNALKIVLVKKSQEMQSLLSSYTSTINTQIQSIIPTL